MLTEAIEKKVKRELKDIAFTDKKDGSCEFFRCAPDYLLWAVLAATAAEMELASFQEARCPPTCASVMHELRGLVSTARRLLGNGQELGALLANPQWPLAS